MTLPTPQNRLRGTTLLLASGLPILLRRMRSDFAREGSLRSSTAAAMWFAYGLGTVAYVDAIRLGTGPQRDAVGVTSLVAATLGGGVLFAGMGAFQDPSQVTGTRSGDLVTDGIYRYSRNPQYTGLILLAPAGAAAARSAPAAAVAAGLAATYRYWVPVEEASLRKSFGERYRRYEEATPRWFGRKGRASQR